MIHSAVQQLKTKYAQLAAFTLTEVLLAAGLVGVVSMLAVSALNVSGQIQGIQSNKVVQAAMMEIQASATKYKQRNGMVNATDNPELLLSLLDSTPVPNGQLIDGDHVAETIQCGSNDGGGNIAECRKLKSGAIVTWWGWPTLNWGGATCTSPIVCGPIFPARNIHVIIIGIDPDGVDSDPTNDVGQSAKVMFTMQGTFLTSTQAQLRTLEHGGGVTGAKVCTTCTQPRYFRLDK